MEAVLKFLHMGGYAAFVWPAVGVAVIAMVALLVHSMRTLRQRERLLANLTGGDAPNSASKPAPNPAPKPAQADEA